MSNVPDQLLYTPEHEWIRTEGDAFVIGITEYAQESLGDITYVELPAEGTTLSPGDTFGVVESVKAASDLYAPIGGEVIARNPDLDSAPEKVNQDPYASGWMIKVKAEGADLSGLLSAEAYRAHIGA